MDAAHESLNVPRWYVGHIPATTLFFPAHWHENIELVYVHDGVIEITVDGQSYHCEKGTLFAIRPHTIHSYHSNQYNQITLIPFRSDIFDLPLVEQSALYFLNEIEQQQMEHFSHTLSFDQEERTPLGSIANLAQILLLMQNHKPNHVLKNLNNEHVELGQKILRYIKEHLRSPLTLNEVAHEFGFNSSYFSGFFKKYFGVSFKSYLIQLKVQTACQELENSDRPIIEIAYDLGYQNLRSFNRNFIDLMHLSPREYRKKHLPSI